MARVTQRFALVLLALGLFMRAEMALAQSSTAPATQDAVVAEITGMTNDSYSDPSLNSAALTYENSADKAKKAADAGDPYAENDLGVAYVLGIGVAKDPAAGAALIAKSAAQGDQEAMVNLAQLYRGGLGVPKDPTIAVKWLIKAGASSTSLAFMECLGEGTPVDFSTAAYIFAKAGDDGSVIGAYEAGLALSIGRGAPQNLTLAYYYFSIASRYKDFSKSDHALALIKTIMTKSEIEAGTERFAKWRRLRPVP